MERRFKDEHGDEWHVYHVPQAGFMASKEGHFPAKMKQPGFKFRNLTSNKTRFLKEEDAPSDLNLEKSHEEELRQLLDLATAI